jgi:type II secretory pathway pseudopilin PulG
MSQFQPPTQPPQYTPPPEMNEPPRSLDSTMPTPVLPPPKKRMRRNNKIALGAIVSLIVIAALIVVAIVTQPGATQTQLSSAEQTAQAANVAATNVAEQNATAIAQSDSQLSNDLTQTAMTPTAQPTTPVDTTSVGSTQSSGPWSITVNSIKTAVSDNQFEVPKQGNEFILINFTALNTDASAHEMNPLFFTLRDDSGTSYTWNLLTIASNPEGTVVSGQKLRGDLSYEIPMSVHSLTLQFDSPDDLDNSQIVQWNLTV